MASRHRLFRFFYRVGFTPWDGHPLPTGLRNLIEGQAALPPGAALDLGCGTGDNSIYLAQHGWTVTGVDFVSKALERARAKAAAGQVAVDFREADVTRLRSVGVDGSFGLLVDSGCLHGMSDDDRHAYVREVTAVAAPDARLLVIAFAPGAMFGVPGIDQAEMQRRFDADWNLVSASDEKPMSGRRRGVARHYLFVRRPS